MSNPGRKTYGKLLAPQWEGQVSRAHEKADAIAKQARDYYRPASYRNGPTVDRFGHSRLRAITQTTINHENT